jgi:hypothetical protein
MRMTPVMTTPSSLDLQVQQVRGVLAAVEVMGASWKGMIVPFGVDDASRG